MIQRNQQETKLTSTILQPRKNVQFSSRIDKRQRSRTKSLSILKKKSSYLPPLRMTRIKSGTTFDLKNKLESNEQNCDNHQNNQLVKKDYLAKIDQLSRFSCYQDNSFPTTNISLFPNGLAQRKVVLQEEEKIVWKRIPEIFGSKDLVLWTVNPSGNIIKGTDLCPDYLPIGMNCVRSNKALLRHIFQRQISNPQGIYYIKLFQNNKWQYIIIDDYIPVIEKKRGYLSSYIPIFSYIPQNRLKKQSIEIWYYLLEKAYAKVYSSYENLCVGNVSDFFTDITGYSCTVYPINFPSLKWNDIFKRPEVLAIGLTPDKKPVSITKQLKNPRIYFYLPDKSSTKITVWPQDLKRYFEEAYIWGENSYCYWGSSIIREKNNQIISVKSFTLKQPGRCCINLIQKDIKCFPKNSNYDYSWMRLILLEKQFNGAFRWIQGDYNNSRALKIEGNLEAGEYLILVIPQWKYKSHPLWIILKAQMPISIVKESYQQGTLEEGCADLAQRFGQFNQLTRYLCSYNCFHEEMGMVIENINNQKMKGSTKIRRAITGLNIGSLQIYPWNKQFTNNLLQIDIKADKCFTVILLTKDGINSETLTHFKGRNEGSWGSIKN